MEALIVLLSFAAAADLALGVEILWANIDGEKEEIRWKGFWQDLLKLEPGVFRRYVDPFDPLSRRWVLFGLILSLFSMAAYPLSLGFGSFFLGFLLAVVLLALSAVDVRHQVIPDAFNLAIVVLAVVYQTVYGDLTGQAMVLGALAGGGFLFLLAILGGMGGGDIKMMAAAGLMLGPQATALALFLGFLLGSIVSIGLLATRRKGRKDMISFGPFLACGVLLSHVFYGQILEAYWMLVTRLLL